MNRFLFIGLALCFPLDASAAELALGEWFIDGDPGRGAGTPFAVPAAETATTTVAVPAVTLNGLGTGYHLLGVRVKDGTGEWGHVVWRAFHKQEEPPESRRLAAGEWFIDSDPGAGSGTAFAVPEVATANLSPQIPTVTLSSLPEGYHLLGVRLRDDLERWGPIQWRAFHIDRLLGVPPNVVSVEYRVVHGGVVVASGSSGANPPGSLVELAVRHGNGALTTDEDYLLQAFPVDALGRRGHAIHAPFAFRSYAQLWMGQHFTPAEIANPLISGDGEDPDGDGLTNLEERLFALNPRSSGDAASATPGIASGADLTLDFRVPGGGTLGADGIYRTSNLQFVPRYNADLGAWNSIPASWITGWSLTDAGGGAARLRLELATANLSGMQFFLLEGSVAPAAP